MKTGSFKTFAGAGRISIARYAPRGTPPGFRVFPRLAPGPWFNSVDADEYRHRFATEILGRLDPEETWDLLHTLVPPGVEPVLLCWEKPPFTVSNWCHRRLVADWFEEHLGLPVPELETTPPRLAAGPSKQRGMF